jgi:carbon monoxide dehydrogenase subunit G
VRITGENTIDHPVEKVWEALLDPAVLVRTIPGCERLETTGEHAYAMTVTAGVAAIRGTYDGRCSLSDLSPHESLVMRLQGAGAPGTIDATVKVAFTPVGDGSTRVGYDADAVVGGMVGGVGQRMLGSVSKRMAAEFFANVGAAIGDTGPRVTPATGTAPTRGGGPDGEGEVGRVFTAPPRPASSQQDFLRGVALGAGLVLLGVAFGGLFGRRRR